MTQSQPPITRTTHTLPFDKLSPRDFERLCLWLVEREGYQRAEHLGAAGSEQGRDIVAWREGALWAFQCKRVQRFGPKAALAEVQKVLTLPEAERPVGLVFLITCDVSANTRQQARERCGEEIECHFWAGTELDEAVQRHSDIVHHFFQIVEMTRAEPDRQRKLTLLDKVRHDWIQDFLEKSVHSEALIELDKVELAEAVDHPWDMVVQMPGRQDRPLPPGAQIADIFDEMGRSLLILGEPGSGKTITLLGLARDAMARAERYPRQPIPAVFLLSSWTEKRGSMADWLVYELHSKYGIPKKYGRPWVENDELLLLLDGLDEVKPEFREACVQALNRFRQEHLAPLVVCSRVADYEALTTRLKLEGAILLQPFTPEQIDAYLDRLGPELETMRTTLQDDATLQELARSPLMLSIMTLAYRGMWAQDLGPLDSIEARREHVLDAYVQQMFQRREPKQPYSPGQTIRWLTWLAQKMSQHAQTVFLIDWMQPSWLQTGAQRRLYTIIAGLSVGLVFGLTFGLIFGVGFGWAFGLSVGLIGGLIFVLSVELANIEPVEVLKWSWREGVKGLVLGLIFVPIFGLSHAKMEARIVPNQGIRQSAKNAVIVWLILGLIGGLANPIGRLIYGLPFGLRTLISGLIVGLIFWLVFGLSVGLEFGGLAVIQHYILRLILYRNGHVPWNYVRFLDYTAERIFLRKVGGGYIFVHRLLQEYFASLDQGQ